MRYFQRLINWIWYLRYSRIRPQPTLDEVLSETMAANAEAIAHNAEKNNAVLASLSKKRGVAPRSPRPLHGDI